MALMSSYLRGFNVLLACGLVAGLVVEAAPATREQADAFWRKVQVIAEPKGTGGQLRRTIVSEDELNSWLALDAPALLPEGISNSQTALLGEGRLRVSGVVDLDVLGRGQAAAGNNPLTALRLLGGRLDVVLTGTLEAREGKGRLAVDTVTLGGVQLPDGVLQEVKSFYATRGVRLDDPFPLPADIQQITIDRGSAAVIQ